VSRLSLARIAALSLTLALGALVAGASGRARVAGTPAPADQPNPCFGPDAKSLRCPDLQIGRPSAMFTSRTAGGRVLLHATSNIKSRGLGPIEIHGRRIAKRKMRVTQRIYRTDGSHMDVRTKGRLHFYYIPGQGRYWKFADAAAFELWSLDRDLALKRVVRRGPKTRYCLRDLVRTHPSRRSPRQRVYPGCNEDPTKKFVTLGTSVGWSDIYPSTYYEQYINVTGLRGCFAYLLAADPKNHIYESNESNNLAKRIVRLPFESRKRCR
jgi:hypothetical protein